MSGKTYVFNIQHYSLHDGPGIRTIIFLKGCPLRCRWCCNPESQSYEPEISYVESRCIGREQCGLCSEAFPQGAVSFTEQDKAQLSHELCSRHCESADCCPSQAIKIEGKLYSAKKLIDIVERDAVFYAHGAGGLTVSGGEPLTHRDFLMELLAEAKKRRLHTAVETCGYADYDVLREAAGLLDYILFDIKHMDAGKHQEYTGRDNRKILDNFLRLCEDYPELPKKVRTPVIPSFNDTERELDEIASFLDGKPNVFHELLPYHSFGRGKYKALGREYPMGDAQLSEEIREKLL